MLQSYPATKIHKKVLKYQPKQKHCLLRGELENLKYLSDAMVFLWLTNNNGFWYHIHYVKGSLLVGYMLDGDRWKYRPISMKDIYSYF